MCFIISIIGLVLGVQFFMQGLYLYAAFAIAVALFFIVLMIKNIYHVKKLREEKNQKEKQDDR
jgi:low affinity Fe/Cu permease